jgi:hypothetical protein
MVRHMVEERAMPPWSAGEGSLPMSSDRSLSEEDRRDVIAWIAAGAPEGDAADAAAAVRFSDGWRIGTPDLILEAPEQSVPAEGTVPYRYIAVPVSVEEDRWVSAVEIRVDAPRVVHHVLAFLQYPEGHPQRALQPDFRGGLAGYFAAMVPGEGALEWGDGRAKRLPAGTLLVFQVHYTTDGTAARDRPRLGVRFAAGPPREEVRTLSAYTMRFAIPPGAPRHEVRASRKFTGAGRILAFMPHMHLRGTAFRYELETPDGARRTLLDVPKWDFNWQWAYRLREPLDVPAGSRLHATGWFDNSPGNPGNPDPSREVRFGEQTWEEMMIGYFEWVDGVGNGDGNGAANGDGER